MGGDPYINIFYELECGHTVFVRRSGLQGYNAFCHDCDGLHHITDVITHEWRAVCTICKFSRWAGQSESLAGMKATAHYLSKGHNTITEYGENPQAARERRRLVKAGVCQAIEISCS